MHLGFDFWFCFFIYLGFRVHTKKMDFDLGFNLCIWVCDVDDDDASEDDDDASGV